MQAVMGGLPRRDLWLLPLIMLATVLALLIGAELAARVIWPEQLVNACRLADSADGVRYRANCSTTMKASEGPWYVASYNNCGYRSDAPCGPLPAGDHRIALLGTSLAEGYLVEYRDTIAARLETDMTQLCHSPVQVQNLGSLGYFGDWLLPRMDEALRLQPSSVVLVLSPYDIEQAGTAAAAEDAAPPPPSSLKARLASFVGESRAAAMAKHFLYLNPSVYLPLYLRYGGESDYLRPPLSAKWQHQLEVADRLIGALAARARRANVPLSIAFIPLKPQVALMASDRTVPPGIDPLALQKALAPIAARHGVGFIDTSMALRTQPAPERLYYQVDGHLSGEGQPIAAAYIAQQLAGASEGPFATCRGTMAASMAGRMEVSR